ncbi:MAG TPA: GspH/FimT family pseudopilin [Burkholderiaceae bacterium]|nr:GspH/FimT family pseudopilin [Burkholderiaceae bacterium]
MVTLIVAGVVATLLVAPAIQGMIARHRVQAVQGELIGDLQLARSEQAQRNGTSTEVSVTFGGDASVTCYTIHTGTTPCDCTLGPGSACGGVVGAQEIKTQQIARADNVTLAASSPSGSRITFQPPQGLVTPSNLVIDVQSPIRGQVRTAISGLGVPSVCSPDGSILGVRTPCP